MITKPTTALDYNNGTLPEGDFRIGASQFNQFMQYPHQWFREKILNESGFNGNTASVIGTIVHYCAECKANGKEPSLAEIDQYLDNNNNNPDIDFTIVMNAWKPMAMTLVNNYVLPNKANLHSTEEFVTYEIAPHIHVGGSIDRLENVGDGNAENSTLRIVDYKTYSSSTKPKSIPLGYKYQLLVYAYVLTKLNRPVSEIRLVYVNREIDKRSISEKTGKPIGKLYPPEVTVLTKAITQDDLDFIESTIMLCVETYQKYLEEPSLAYLLYRDYRLKDL